MIVETVIFRVSFGYEKIADISDHSCYFSSGDCRLQISQAKASYLTAWKGGNFEMFSTLMEICSDLCAFFWIWIPDGYISNGNIGCWPYNEYGQTQTPNFKNHVHLEYEK